MRIALGVEYNGTYFKGWQSQPGQRTVQACLEIVLNEITNTEIKVVAAGRTDAGVHALEQVVHSIHKCRVILSTGCWVLHPVYLKICQCIGRSELMMNFMRALVR